MCTVVTRQRPGEPVRIMAIRDELASRAFDEPGEWWPDHPGVIGGRDRTAGGSWCVSDAATGTTALVLNRPERQRGTPSRGVLPLAAISHGPSWPAHVDHRAMATFTLLLVGPDEVRAWGWDGAELRDQDLEPGTHFVTTRGVDPPGEKTDRYAARFDTEDWREVVTSECPEDDLSALIVRHPVGDDVYATVLGQQIESTPGRLSITWSRTPWIAEEWQAHSWRTDR